MYKYFGLWAFVVLFFGLLFIVWRWPHGKHMTFSQHIAGARYTIAYYILLFSFALPLLVLFFTRWFVPTFGLPYLFSWFIVLASLAQYACTFIPEIGGWKTQWHQALAGLSAICLLPPIGFLVVSNALSGISKGIAVISLSVMIYIVITACRNNGKHRQLLILQAGYFAAFFAPILFMSYAQ